MSDYLKILLVDDDEVDRLLFKRSLEKTRLNTRLIFREDFASGLQVIQEEEFDCIFLDYLLPGGNGLKLIREIRNLNIATPVVIVTSQGDEQIAVDMMKAGATDYISKNLLTPDGISQILRNTFRTTQLQEDKREVERSLRLSESKLAEAQRLARLGSWELNLSTYQMQWSTETFRIFGIAPYSSVPDFNLFKQYIAEDEVSRITQLFIKASINKNNFSTDTRIITDDGTIKHVNIQGSVILNQKKARQIFGTIQDITDRKRIEEELINARVIAQQSARIKEQFLANMSHEIRTPMNGIIGFTDLLLKTQLTMDQFEYVNAIKTSSDILMVVINDVLDISKIEAGKMTFEQKEFKLKDLISSLIDFFSIRAEAKKIRLINHFDTRLPEMISGDPLRLNQVLMNLIGNALKFTEKGAIEINTKCLRDSVEDITIEFCVTDTGIGIPEDKQALIFESFTQAHTQTARKYGGTGLGLAICKQLVELQGGNIAVRSKSGKGSAFTVVLTFKRARPKVFKGVKTAEPRKALKRDLNGVRVLLVEDNELNRLLAATILKDWGIMISTAENGRVALEKLKHQDYDLVLMDIQMPEMDGYEATQYIRKNFGPKSSIPIMAMTAHAQLEEAEKCRNFGMNDYLSKPFNANDLYEKIANLLKDMPETKSSSKIIDLTYLEQVSKGNKKFMLEMVDLFIQKTPDSIKNIRHTFDEQDWLTLASAVHKIKPTYAFMGIEKAKKLIPDLEKKIKERHDPGTIQQDIADLEQITTQAITELKSERTALTDY